MAVNCDQVFRGEFLRLGGGYGLKKLLLQTVSERLLLSAFFHAIILSGNSKTFLHVDCAFDVESGEQSRYFREALLCCRKRLACVSDKRHSMRQEVLLGAVTVPELVREH